MYHNHSAYMISDGSTLNMPLVHLRVVPKLAKIQNKALQCLYTVFVVHRD